MFFACFLVNIISSSDLPFLSKKSKNPGMSGFLSFLAIYGVTKCNQVVTKLWLHCEPLCHRGFERFSGFVTKFRDKGYKYINNNFV